MSSLKSTATKEPFKFVSSTVFQLQLEYMDVNSISISQMDINL